MTGVQTCALPISTSNNSRDSQLTGNNSGMASSSTTIGNNGTCPFHNGFPIRIGHVRDQNISSIDAMHFADFFNNFGATLSNFLPNTTSFCKHWTLTFNLIPFEDLFISPAVVGCGDATKTIKDGDEITVSCAEGDIGYIYSGILPFEINRLDVDTMPELPVKVMLNVGNPERAFTFQSIPNSGVGLARLEFLISNTIGIHPKALLQFDKLEDDQLKKLVTEKTRAYESPVEFYIERLKEGIATIAAAFFPKPVIVRLSDFKSNEYANLLGGSLYEPHEENPMLGFRGASRYVSDDFKECFALECAAIKRVREEMGLSNVEVMVPFVRTVNEARQVVALLEEQGLKRGQEGLRLIMMCELPSNALLAEQFLEYFDGFSIGSNDLTQLTLGLDRDSGLVASQFDERDEAVKILLHRAIQACKQQNKYIGICGQGPSDHQDFAEWLMEEGIDSISLNPDSVLETCLFLEKHNSKVS